MKQRAFNVRNHASLGTFWRCQQRFRWRSFKVALIQRWVLLIGGKNILSPNPRIQLRLYVVTVALDTSKLGSWMTRMSSSSRSRDKANQRRKPTSGSMLKARQALPLGIGSRRSRSSCLLPKSIHWSHRWLNRPHFVGCLVAGLDCGESLPRIKV